MRGAGNTVHERRWPARFHWRCLHGEGGSPVIIEGRGRDVSLKG